MLTRFVTAVPYVTISAEETLSILMNHVITKYSLPIIIKSDNDFAFRNELTRAFAEYAGIRRAFVLPYNAPANGMTEQAVARIARLLVRHTQHFRNWPDTLPMHLSTGVSPFFALYGGHPISLPELQSPSLVELTETGNEFVETLATRLRQAWLAERDTSESIRLDAAARADAHHRPWLKPNTIMDSVGGIRWEIVCYSSTAASFRVLEVIPEYNDLRVDSQGTGIQPVVKVTACKRAPDDWEVFDDSSPASGRFDAPATTFVAARGNPYEVGGQINQPDLTQGEPNVFLVIQILEARREKGKWKYVTLWSGYDTPTLEPEESFYGCDAYVEGMLMLAQVRYAKEIRRAAHHSGERRSCVRTAAADITNLSTHQVERDRPSTSTADGVRDRYHQQPGTHRARAAGEREVIGIDTRHIGFVPEEG
eukprot:1132434-Pleurochrysis_carterae.AAC.1